MAFSLVKVAFLFFLASDAVMALQVTFFERPHFKGGAHTMDFDRDSGCHNLPSFWSNRASSLSTHGNCLVAYELTGCSGRGTTLQPGTASHHDLSYWSLQNQISSFRSCYSSNVSSSRPRPPSGGSTPQVTFYDDLYFQGNSFVFYPKWSKCYNLPSLWYHQARSVESNSGCVTVFEGPNCHGGSTRVAAGQRVRQASLSFKPC